MHFIPSLVPGGKKKSCKVFWYVCRYPRDRQGSRCNGVLLILPGATDLVYTHFHLFMNTIITAGHSELSYCLSKLLSLIQFIASAAPAHLRSMYMTPSVKT